MVKYNQFLKCLFAFLVWMWQHIQFRKTSEQGKQLPQLLIVRGLKASCDSSEKDCCVCSKVFIEDHCSWLVANIPRQ